MSANGGPTHANGPTTLYKRKIQRKKQVESKSIFLNVDNILLTVNKEPLVSDVNVGTTSSEFAATDNGVNITYTWTFDMRIQDTKNLVKYDAIPSKSCLVTSKVIDNSQAFTGKVNVIAADKKFIFTLTSIVPMDKLDKLTYTNTLATVKFNLFVGTQSVERTFNVALPIYNKKQGEIKN